MRFLLLRFGSPQVAWLCAAAWALSVVSSCQRWGFERVLSRNEPEGPDSGARPPDAGARARRDAAASNAQDAGGGLTDASVDDAGGGEGAGSDADVPAEAECTGVAQFGLPVPVVGLPSPAFSPSLSGDGLTLLFASDGELYSGERSNADSATFGNVTPLAVVNSGLRELTPGLSADGLTLFFARDQDGGGLFRSLFQATRSSLAEDFGSVTELVVLNDPFFSDILPRPSADGLQLYFTSNRFGGVGATDVWWSTRDALSDPFSAPSVRADLSTLSDDSGASPSADNLSVVWASNRSGTLGEQDLWVATRTDPGGSFSGGNNLVELNSTQNDLDPVLRSDGGEILFASDRSGETRIYRALRCPP